MAGYLPDKIIVEDTTGDGYYIAEYQNSKEDADEQEVPVYKVKEYYHDLESAMRDF